MASPLSLYLQPRPALPQHSSRCTKNAHALTAVPLHRSYRYNTSIYRQDLPTLLESSNEAPPAPQPTSITVTSPCRREPPSARSSNCAHLGRRRHPNPRRARVNQKYDRSQCLKYCKQKTQAQGGDRMNWPAREYPGHPLSLQRTKNIYPSFLPTTACKNLAAYTEGAIQVLRYLFGIILIVLTWCTENARNF